MRQPRYILHLFVFLSLLLLGACTLVPGVHKNDEIKSSKRGKFHELNTEVLSKLKSGDHDGLRSLLSAAEAKQDIARLVDSISQKLKENDYKLLDEYYVINKYADSDTIVATGPLVNRYGLKYPYVTFEEYFAYLLPKQGDNQYMIGLIYGNFKEGWRLINISLAPYSIDGKTGPELYQLARDDNDKANYTGAAQEAKRAELCMKPAPYWQYPDLPDAEKFYKKTQFYEATFHFPFVLAAVSTGPMVVSMGDKYTVDGVYPQVSYMTHYDIHNTAAVEQENKQVNIAINKMMPGLAKSYPFICYSAYNQKPGDDGKTPHFDMTVKPVDTHMPVLSE